jgi:transcriptional regulator with XRE-family HTH domain
MHLSKNIKLIRQLRKQTQPEFGAIFGATKAMIVSYENGKAQPDELFLKKLAKMANVTEDQLRNEDLSDQLIEVEKLDKVNLKGVGHEVKVTVDRDSLIIEQQKEIIRLQAKVNIILITLADVVSKVDNKAIALADGELTEAINRETKHLLRELKEKLSEL